ncbi:hypothetical protein JVT61DRAFT_891 [Boletus reticuloceps]|uniref:Uncharacterized protein n=1 Tax=Boletus reticuloceps TaxID=495285 RepID=A0A8I3AC09_9AGAM|nr:hypothetical protein JVT61DRAFT_891 [Boletus reticuloceps]
MLAKLSALALFLASTTAQAPTISVPDQTSWGTIISVKFDGFDNTNADLLLIGVDIQKTYLIGYQFRIVNDVIKLVLPYVVDQGVQYQLLTTELEYVHLTFAAT